MDVQGPDPGATLSLNAIGKQDTYLLNEDPIYSPFKYSYDRHSNFTKFHRSTTISKHNVLSFTRRKEDNTEGTDKLLTCFLDSFGLGVF